MCSIAELRRRLASDRDASIYEPIFDLVNAQLRVINRDLTEAESAYRAAQERARSLRKERDRAASEVHDRYDNIARFFRYQPQLPCATMIGPTPLSPPALVRQAPLAIEFLRDLEVAFEGPDPPSLAPGFSIDAGEVACDLEEHLSPLEGALLAVDDAKSRIAVAKVKADVAMAEAQRVVPNVGRLLAAVSGLAGNEASVRRARRHGAISADLEEST